MEIDKNFFDELCDRNIYDLPAGSVLDYLILRSRMDEDTKTTTMSCGQIAKIRGTTYPGTHLQVARLVDAGLIEVVGSDEYRRNTYKFPLEFV